MSDSMLCRFCGSPVYSWKDPNGNSESHSRERISMLERRLSELDSVVIAAKEWQRWLLSIDSRNVSTSESALFSAVTRLVNIENDRVKEISRTT